MNAKQKKFTKILRLKSKKYLSARIKPLDNIRLLVLQLTHRINGGVCHTVFMPYLLGEKIKTFLFKDFFMLFTVAFRAIVFLPFGNAFGI